MLSPFRWRLLFFLAQFEVFPDTIRYLLFKYTENRVILLVLTAAGLLAAVLFHRLLARKK
jgi:hypothetical protein